MRRCECGMLRDGPAARVACQSCGTEGCQTCVHELGTGTYCRWCLAGLGTPAPGGALR